MSDNVGTLSNCCRLLSDTSKLEGFINSIGGTALSIGSVKVNTINLMRIAYEQIWFIAFMLVVRKSTIRYEPRFGIKFNMLRFIPCGPIVYGGRGWRGLLSIYHRYIMGHWDLSLESYGNMLIALTLSVTLIANLHLYQHKNRHTADAIGIIEAVALALFISSLMFRLLYT